MKNLKQPIEEKTIDPIMGGELGDLPERKVTPDEMRHKVYLKLEGTGEPLDIEVKDLYSVKKTEFLNPNTGELSVIGLKRKDGTMFRYDIEATHGARYTIGSWEIYYKLLGRDGILTKYAEKHGTYEGAKIRIVRNLKGKYKSWTIEEIAQVEVMTLDQAKAHKEMIIDAIKNRKLYDVTLLNE